MNLKDSIRTPLVLAVIGAVLLGSGGYYGVQLWQENLMLQEGNTGLDQSLRFVRAGLKRVQGENTDLLQNLKEEQEANGNLQQNLQTEQEKNDRYNSQLKDISAQVNTLQKLSATDKELLKKYSKVYFLSENYVPAKLSLVNAQYLLNKSRSEVVHTDAMPFLVRMLDTASSSGVELRIASAYRSFEDQMSVKTGYKVVYGSGANRFSADQGYSEHQLGTTVDLTTPTLAVLSLTLEKDPAYRWMAENAHRFGFVLSYPKNNAYYQFEPWHWRFVGVALAQKLHDEGKYFYDLTQREIDTYLISIFD